MSTGDNQTPTVPQPDSNIPARKAPEIPDAPNGIPQEPEPQIQDEKPEENDGKKSILSMLQSRKNQYKKAALKVKKTGDTQTAIKFMKIVKQFEMVMNAIKEGKDIDLSNMPGSPEDIEASTSGVKEANFEQMEVQHEQEPEEVKLIDPPTLLAGLIQRMDVFKLQLINAVQEGDIDLFRVVIKYSVLASILFFLYTYFFKDFKEADGRVNQRKPARFDLFFYFPLIYIILRYFVVTYI